jgi:integrase
MGRKVGRTKSSLSTGFQAVRVGQRRGQENRQDQMGVIHRLTDRAVRAAKKPGLLADGGSLYLQIKSPAAKSWIFRYESGGRQHYLGLGSLDTLTLAEAREKALQARKLRLEGKDPLEHKRAQRAAIKAETAKALTFEQAAREYIAAHGPSWRNAMHAQQWEQSLRDFVLPIIGATPVVTIDTAAVLRVLQPIWQEKTETATRVRSRIENIIDWAAAAGYREGSNPARWKGHLKNLLAAPGKIAKVEHHPALPYREIGAFMTELRQREGGAVLALEFLILTATRAGEVIGARWSEIDLEARTWIVPAERTKAHREHRVPISSAAMAVLRRTPRRGDHVFIDKRGKALGRNALLYALDHKDTTVHGLRSTFRDWAAERTSFPREVAEAALAHAIPNAVEAAYRRSDLFEHRRKLMKRGRSTVRSRK